MSFLRSTHLSIRFSFFLHGESQVCASIDVRQHMPLRRLQPYHLSVATQDHQQVPGNLSVKSFIIVSCIITGRRRSCGKVMFSQVSIILLRWGGGEIPMWPLPMMHWAIPPLHGYQTWDLPPPPGYQTEDLPPSLTSVGYQTLESCSKLFPYPLTGTDI